MGSFALIIIEIALILAAAFIINKAGRKFIVRAVRKTVRDVDQEAEKKRENTLIGIFGGVLRGLIWLVAGLMILSAFDINIGPILAGAGVLGVALGFGAQYMIRDFLAGLFIILENQYRVGDVVCLDGTCGGVEAITLRKTVMRDLDGKVHHIPNGTFKVAANLTTDYSRAHMNVSVAYKEDLDRVIDVINRVGQEMANVAPWKDYIIKPIQVMGPGPNDFSPSGVEIKVLGETKPLKQWDVLKEFRRRLKKTFDAEGIEIPFPQMSIWQKQK